MGSSDEFVSDGMKPYAENDDSSSELLKLPLYLQIIMKFNGFHTDDSLAYCTMDDDFFSGLDLSYNDMSGALRSTFLKNLKKHHQRTLLDLLLLGHQKMITLCQQACYKKWIAKSAVEYVD